MSANPKYFDTIVIGAGMSGLACAARLFQHRARAGSVVVLEARERVGGRIGAVYVNGNRLDTGANWIHGIGTEEKPNPLMEILPHKRYRQLSSMVSFRPTEDNTLGEAGSDVESGEWQHIPKTPPSPPVPSGESQVIPSDAAAMIQGAMWRTIGEMHELAGSLPASEARETTVLSALRKSETLRDAFKALPSTYHRALGGMMQFMEPMEAAPLAAQSAEHQIDFRGMSLLEFAIEDFDGDQVFLQDGYIAIINEVAKDLIKAGAIHMGTEVELIDWRSSPIAVKTTSGEVYTAKNVVCTLPLGVLKHKQHGFEAATQGSLFQPTLPQEKTQAIAALGFGTLDKIFMVYESSWWTREPYLSIIKRGISKSPFAKDKTSGEKDENVVQPDSFAGFTDELPGLQIHEDGSVTTGPRLLSLTNLNSLSGFPVLCAFVSCANAVRMERYFEGDAAGYVHRALTRWFGHEPPKTKAVHVTKWAYDPYSYGSYSHMITGLSDTRHRETFQVPVKNKDGAMLRFAGEHTSRNHFATVHGALLSGWREADSILEKS